MPATYTLKRQQRRIAVSAPVAPRKKAKPRGRPFPSGNPGRPAGSRNKVTLLVERVLEEETEDLVRALVAHAKKTANPTAVRFLAEHMRRRSRIAPFDLPPVKTSHDVVAAIRRVSSLIAAGDLEPSQGVALTRVLQNQFGVLRSAEMHAERRALRGRPNAKRNAERHAPRAEPRPPKEAADTGWGQVNFVAPTPPPGDSHEVRDLAERQSAPVAPQPEAVPDMEAATAPVRPPPKPVLELPPSWLESADGRARAARMLGLDDPYDGSMVVMSNPTLVAPRIVRDGARPSPAPRGTSEGLAR